MTRRPILILILILMFSAGMHRANAQTPCVSAPFGTMTGSPLPPITGKFKVGRTTYVVKNGGEDLVLYLWYPADASTRARAVPYIVGWPQMRENIAAYVQRLFGDAYCAFEQGRVFSYAAENADISKDQDRYPLVLFAAGLGITSQAYTAEIEDLVSHGYVVAGVEYTPAMAFVVFPDGKIASYDSDRFNAMSKLPEGSPERLLVEKTLVDNGATALIAALDGLTKLRRPHRLAGILNLDRVGTLGHSFGAMSAVRAAQRDRRIRASLSQDGFSDAMVAFAAEGGRQMKTRVGLFFRTLSPNQGRSIPKLFESLPRGSMLAKTSHAGFAHMSFSDLLLLRAGDNPEGRAAALRNLDIVRTVTRTFFDNALLGSPLQPSALPGKGYPEVTIQTSVK